MLLLTDKNQSYFALLMPTTEMLKKNTISSARKQALFLKTFSFGNFFQLVSINLKLNIYITEPIAATRAKGCRLHGEICEQNYLMQAQIGLKNQ